MGRRYRTTHRIYSAWNYQRETEDLDRFSEQGWQLIHGGAFSSRFVHNPDVRYRYQLDYRKVEDMGRYIETFREQGWEYVNSTFNNWHYFRKLYDPQLPESAYEIFTDRESLQAMNRRWARLGFVVSGLDLLLGVLNAVRLILTPQLPVLVQTVTMLFAGLILLRGACIMHDPDRSRSRRGDCVLMPVFLAVILLGCTGSVVLADLRPHYTVQADTVLDAGEAPVTVNWMSFDVRYTDFYYFDLDLEADAPVGIQIVDAQGRTVFRSESARLQEEALRIRLGKGTYTCLYSADPGTDLRLEMQVY